MRSTLARLVAAAALCAQSAGLPALAHAITVDGQLDPSYSVLSMQTTQTIAGDATDGRPDWSHGSELDAAYGAVDGGVLYLFLAGNLQDTICGSFPCTDSDVLEVFIDSQPGGQNTLLGPSPLGYPFAGLTFDAGFAPDYALELIPAGALQAQFSRTAYFSELPTGGGGASYLLGSGSNPGAPGTLSGGTNPYGIAATLDNRNTGGVIAGCGAASGAGVATGIELAIPLAAIGSPTGCIQVSTFVCEEGGTITNQVLGPVPSGTCFLGSPSSVNFATLAGSQFFTVCAAATPSRATSWGRIKTIYR